MAIMDLFFPPRPIVRPAPATPASPVPPKPAADTGRKPAARP
jgi:hypothetical protein